MNTFEAQVTYKPGTVVHVISANENMQHLVGQQVVVESEYTDGDGDRYLQVLCNNGHLFIIRADRVHKQSLDQQVIDLLESDKAY